MDTARTISMEPGGGERSPVSREELRRMLDDVTQQHVDGKVGEEAFFAEVRRIKELAGDLN